MTNKFADLLKTPLLELHQNLDAKIVDFGGWALPVNYGSQIDEHLSVRKKNGVFDVSHMTVSDVTGKDTLPFLSKLLANDIAKASSIQGKALYSCMLNENGGVIDDLIVYYLNDEHCRLVTNAGTNKKDMAWLALQSKSFDVAVTEKPELALIAIQGPEAIETVKQVSANWSECISKLKRFQGAFYNDDTFIGRTGYTGEDGLEAILPAEDAKKLWTNLIDKGVQPCGLGARDTLRLEAGMSLYGNDLSEEYTPLDSGLSWTVANKDDRDFIGKSSLEAPAKFKMIGLKLLDKGVLRSHMLVQVNDNNVGEITSGTFSPTLDYSIGIARINADTNIAIGDIVKIEKRKKLLNAEVVSYPFI